MNSLKEIRPTTTRENRPRVLVIEDEPGLVYFIEMGLAYEGFEVVSASTGPGGLEIALTKPFDLVLLDLLLPGMDGLEVCRKIRQASPVPIFFVTAVDSLDDRLRAFEAGADDYIVKPFQFKELVARMRAILRRQTLDTPGPANTFIPPDTAKDLNFIQVVDLTLNVTTREFWRGDRLIELSMREFELLELFMLHPNHVLKRQTILDRIWGFDFTGDANIIEVYVRYLRNKLGSPNVIQTVRGVGYVLRYQPRQPGDLL
jgi:DNA-binding response OmpR family regulator